MIKIVFKQKHLISNTNGSLYELFDQFSSSIQIDSIVRISYDSRTLFLSLFFDFYIKIYSWLGTFYQEIIDCIIIMIKSIVLVCLIILMTNAWWDRGHMLVSQIAYNHLTQTNRQAARDQFDKLITAFNPFTDGKSQDFVEAAVWPDDIKNYNASFFDSYHFVNIPYDPDFMFKGMTQFQVDINAINIINHCKTVIGSNKLGVSFQRAFMARFLLHVVGDIHQPLHTTNMFNNSFKNGDLGGNLITVTLIQGGNLNLHSYFDSIALEQDPVTRVQRPINDSYRAQLQDRAKEIMSTYSFESLGDLAKSKDPHFWGVEAYKIAVDKIYSFTASHKQITQQYQDEMRNVLQRQIALGGYRLAETIAAVLA